MSFNTNKTIVPNYWYAILSVALVLILLGFFSLLLLQSNVLVTNLKEKINIIVELKDDVQQEDIAAIKEKLLQRDFLKPESLDFVSKSEAMELLRADFGDDFMQLDMVNPLFHTLNFNVKSAYLEATFLSNLRTELIADEHIRDVFYQENIIDKIAQNLSKVAWIGIVIGLFFLLVAVFLIHNTMRLAIHSQRFLIKNMELVGASWGFISRPFLIKSLWNGLISAVLAILVLFAVLYWLNTQIEGLHLFQDRAGLIGICILLIVLGILISGLSTYRVVRKYLRMRLDDLY